jgi:hypothetical protein
MLNSQPSLASTWLTRLTLFAFVAVPVWLVWPESRIHHQPGILVPSEPEQVMLKTPQRWDLKGFHFTALATYSIEGELLSKARYRTGRESEISPIDFALGWGCMSNEAVIDKLSISQSGRWYEYRWSNLPPVDPDQIVCHSSNNHLIPANDGVRSLLLSMKMGSIVTLKGYLVLVEGSDEFRWASSLMRTDTGSGACEVMWVESVSIRE